MTFGQIKKTLRLIQIDCNINLEFSLWSLVWKEIPDMDITKRNVIIEWVSAAVRKCTKSGGLKMWDKNWSKSSQRRPWLHKSLANGEEAWGFLYFPFRFWEIGVSSEAVVGGRPMDCFWVFEGQIVFGRERRDSGNGSRHGSYAEMFQRPCVQVLKESSGCSLWAQSRESRWFELCQVIRVQSEVFFCCSQTDVIGGNNFILFFSGSDKSSSCQMIGFS